MKKIILLFPLLFGIFLLHYFLVGQAVYGDGIFYWSIARSVVIDHDIRVGNEILHHYSHGANNSYKEPKYPKSFYQKRDKDYRLPIGPSISWIPVLFLVTGIGSILHIFGLPIILNGYSDIYQITVGIENICFILLGLWFVYKLLRQYYNQKVSVITVGLLFFATNLFYYGSFDVINSHPLTFFLSSFFVYYFFVRFSQKWHEWLFLGGLVGALTLTRTQEILFLFFPIVAGMQYCISSKKIAQTIIYLLFIFVGLFLIILPQLMLLHFAYGGLVKSPYLLAASFDFLRSHTLGVLLNYKTGLLFTSPIVLLGVVGLLILAKQKKTYAILGLLFFLAEYYIIASWAFWDQASSYGIRMLISTFPIISLGIAEIIKLTNKKISFKAIYLACCLFILFNMVMIIRFHLSIKNVTFDNGQVTRVAAQDKLNRLFHTNFQLFK